MLSGPFGLDWMMASRESAETAESDPDCESPFGL